MKEVNLKSWCDGGVLCLGFFFGFVWFFRCRQLLYNTVSQGLGKKYDMLLKSLHQVINVFCSPIFLILWKLNKFELLLFFIFASWHAFTLRFPMQFANNFLHDCQQYGESKCTITFAFLSEIREMHFTSLQGRSFYLYSGIGGGEIQWEAQFFSFLLSDMLHCSIGSPPGCIPRGELPCLCCRKGELLPQG